MSEDSPTRYYQKNKERLQKRLVKGITIFPKKRKTKSKSMVVNSIKFFLGMKNKGYLSIKKYHKIW